MSIRTIYFHNQEWIFSVISLCIIQFHHQIFGVQVEWWQVWRRFKTISNSNLYVCTLVTVSIMICPVCRRGPVKYRFQTLYELDSLAVVNARDVGQCKNAFKILMFPDTRMFQAESQKAKVGQNHSFRCSYDITSKFWPIVTIQMLT